MKVFIPIFTALFMFSSMAATKTEKLIKINIAYPAQSTVIGGQIGLILEKSDILKIYGFDATIKRLNSDQELQAAIIEKTADVIITTEANYTALTEKKANVVAFSTLGLEKDFRLMNIINKAYSLKNSKVTEKLNGAFIDAFYFLITRKAQVNKWYADISNMSPEAIDTDSKINKNYNAKNLSDINIKI